MSRTINLKQGFDIRIEGKAEVVIRKELHTSLYAVKPIDFPSLVAKLDVSVGTVVKAGSPLFHDKDRPQVVFTSPVSGVVRDIVRGAKRAILEVVVEQSGTESVKFEIPSLLDTLSRQQIKDLLLRSGLWVSVRQRPYHVVANPDDVPKAIFISGFDSSPLAANYGFIIENLSVELFQKGVDVLRQLTDGKVYLSLQGSGSSTSSQTFANIKGVEINYFTGKHPAGNVGVQIHHLNPVNKGEVVWYVNVQDIVAIGRLFEEGVYCPERVIALAGSEVATTGYYRTVSGASIEEMVSNNLKSENVRFISGNVLTGKKIERDGYIGFYDSVVTVIPEGNYYELFGWGLPGLRKESFSRTFLSALCKRSKYRLDTNFHGEERAFVMSGQYEKVLPMDIYPVYLLKAILAEDIDMMEKLGIYEVAEEDFALCEYICTSKIEIQEIIRKGIQLMMNS